MIKQMGSIVVKKPQQEVAKLFADPKNLQEYQDGFIKKELVSGKAGKVGAVSKMYYSAGNRDMELVETITSNNLPNSFEAHYHHEHMDNTMKATFVALNANETRYEYEYEYTRMNWLMPRLLSILFPNMYRKPAEKWIRQFKEFVEKQ